MTKQVAENPLARTEHGMTFGVRVPHFGPNASRERILDGARLAERLGFDAMWVRDHLLWRPHSHEAQADVTFLEPLITLAAIGAVTSRMQLGTAVMIPVRQPAKVAQEMAALSFLTGGRVVLGVGTGHERAELAAAGLDPDKRRVAVEEMMQILPRLWAEDGVTFDGEVYQLDDATLRPRPVRPIPIWYGGPSRPAVRIAARYGDGWIAGNVPFDTLDDRLALLRSLAEQEGRKMGLAACPRTVVDPNREVARGLINLHSMVHDGWRNWLPPKSGRYETIEDLRGAIVVGDPQEVAEQVVEFGNRGIDHFVFDLRDQFDHFEDVLTLVAEEVIPAVRKAQ